MTAPLRPSPSTPPLQAVAPPVQNGSATVRTPLPSALSEVPAEANARRDAWLRGDGIPAWLVSLILHTVTIILLALLTLPKEGRRGISLVSRPVDPMHGEPTLEILPQNSVPAPDSALAAEQPTELPIAVAAPPSPQALSPLSVQRAPQAEATDMAAQVAELVGEELAVQLPTGGGLGGRAPAGRLEFGSRVGATPRSEEAVELALRWLADHQRNNGSWSFDLEGPPCNGRCDNPRDNPDRLPAPPTAATGLSLLAYLGAGYTHRSGPYTEEVRRGLYYLRSSMRPAALGSDLQMGSMYGHGIASLAIAEAASMTGDEELLRDARELTAFILAARHPREGWGYTPGTPGDITLTGWQVMALKGAKRLEIPMPSDIFASVKTYVDSLSPDQGVHFGYREAAAEATPTAIGLTLQLYLGRPPSHPQQRKGLNELLAAGPQPHNVYHNYYATLALFHAQHPRWDEWHIPLREQLIRTQSRQGHQAGSWHFRDRYGDVGGRLYTTAMCAMILEVYYRYLPLYSGPGEFPL